MVLSAIACTCALYGSIAAPSPSRSILVYSKSAGFRHDSIPVGRRAIIDLGIDRGWTVTCSEDPGSLDDRKLRSYDVIVFLSTTGKFLGAKEEKALQNFVHHGGGVVGIHAAADAEYEWPWYGKMIGAWFLTHPAQQEATVKIEDTTHPSTKDLPNPWARRDEWYDYKASPRGNVQVLASLDQSSYKGSKMANDHPIMWCHDFEGGRVWYTGMGHTQESYADPVFLKMLGEGIAWASEKSRR
jgi:type 1 glutamine amidotransferase